ncbi:MAG: insulinase family protein [Bacilli bacterium]|nr:insulinase family protein [Bacilli bacterium]MBN2877112.1 insulinase family protein [Bacilli bacterium]
MVKIQALQDEFIYQETLSSGLRVAIHPKPDFHNTLVTLQVGFGGTCLFYDVDDTRMEIPAGVAHFLEHLMFHNNAFDLPERFAQSGAEINAYTSKSLTAYQFKTINHIQSLLSDFLGNFIECGITDEVIEKERRIIEYELLMSDDSVHYDMYQRLMRMMYSDYSVHSDVGGTVKDVRKIDRSILEHVFETFYHPKNCTLIITGNVNAEEIITLLQNHPYNQKIWPRFPHINPIISHKSRRIHNQTRYAEDVTEPLITYAVRIPDEMMKSVDKEFLHIAFGSIVANVFGMGSSTFDYLEKIKLMNVSFYTKLSVEKTYGHLRIFIQTNKVKRYQKVMKEILLNVANKPLDEEFFHINKKNIIGNYITVFDSLSRVHDLLCNTMSEGVNLDEYVDHILNLKFEDMDAFRRIFVPENIYSIIYKKIKKN